MRLRADAAVKAGTLNIMAEIDASLEEAIRVLSAFTYLLLPSDLQAEGLSATLGRYVEGFVNHAIREIFLLGVSTHVLEWQDGDRRVVWKREGRRRLNGHRSRTSLLGS